jgi:hypothetical protein
MVEIALIVIFGFSMMKVCSNNKKHWKVLREYNMNIKREEKRRIKEEKVRNKSVKHPKVLYLDDYRLFSKPKEVV